MCHYNDWWGFHPCFSGSGRVYGAGSNQEGQLGLGHCDDTNTFHLLHPFSDHAPIKMLAAGCNTSAALTGNDDNRQTVCLLCVSVCWSVFSVSICAVLYMCWQRMAGCSCGVITRLARSVWGQRATPQSLERWWWGSQWPGCPVDTTTQRSSQVTHTGFI